MTSLKTNKIELDLSPDKFGDLLESNDIFEDTQALKERFSRDGYLFFRDVLNRDEVLDARREIIEKLDSVGEIDRSKPLMDAVYSGRSDRGHIDQGKFIKDLRSGEALKKVCHRGALREFHERFQGGKTRALDYIWMRAVHVGGFTGVHFDWVYMGRGTRNLISNWIPLGDISREEGTLMVLEGSHRNEELQATYGTFDVDRDRGSDKAKKYIGAEGGWLSVDPLDVQKKIGGRWLTADFRAGDFLCFGMFLLHCSTDNQSPEGKLRISTDTRYQLASEPADERWVGDEPLMHR